jgi:hypothetical protein
MANGIAKKSQDGHILFLHIQNFKNISWLFYFENFFDIYQKKPTRAFETL